MSSNLELFKGLGNGVRSKYSRGNFDYLRKKGSLKVDLRNYFALPKDISFGPVTDAEKMSDEAMKFRYGEAPEYGIFLQSYGKRGIPSIDLHLSLPQILARRQDIIKQIYGLAARAAGGGYVSINYDSDGFTEEAISLDAIRHIWAHRNIRVGPMSASNIDVWLNVHESREIGYLKVHADRMLVRQGKTLVEKAKLPFATYDGRDVQATKLFRIGNLQDLGRAFEEFKTDLLFLDRARYYGSPKTFSKIPIYGILPEQKIVARLSPAIVEVELEIKKDWLPQHGNFRILRFEGKKQN